MRDAQRPIVIILTQFSVWMTNRATFFSQHRYTHCLCPLHLPCAPPMISPTGVPRQMLLTNTTGSFGGPSGGGIATVDVDVPVDAPESTAAHTYFVDVGPIPHRPTIVAPAAAGAAIARSLAPSERRHRQRAGRCGPCRSASGEYHHHAAGKRPLSRHRD